MLLNLNESSSPGPDGIHPMFLKRCAEVLALPLTLIYRKVYDSGCLPNEWKVSRVAALYKCGIRADPLNYRPVSLTSVCCKVMERLIVAHIGEYLDENCLLSDRQFGFRRGRSTEDQLLLTYGRISELVDAGRVVDMVYLDFSKAFDLVSHQVLLEKMICLGFNDGIVRWIEDFLIGRKMWVAAGGGVSRVVDVTSGVPQGSVLGPLLFLIYVNSLADELECEWYAFADDFKIYVSLPKSGGGREILQRDLDRVFLVAESWNLKLNAGKCVAMRFGCRGDYVGGMVLAVVTSWGVLS